MINVEAVMHVNGRQMEGTARDFTLDPRRHIQTPFNCAELCPVACEGCVPFSVSLNQTFLLFFVFYIFNLVIIISQDLFCYVRKF